MRRIFIKGQNLLQAITKKFKGVCHNVLKDGDLSYYIYYRDANGKQRKDKIGKKSEGFDEPYCNRIRLNTIAAIKNGELPPNIQIRKKHKVITLNSVADFYFDTRLIYWTYRWPSRFMSLPTLLIWLGVIKRWTWLIIK